MRKAITVTPIWDDANEIEIPEGKEIRMGDDRINSLIAIGAVKEIPEEVTPLKAIKSE